MKAVQTYYPSWRITDQSKPYTPSHKTNVAETIRKAKEQQKK